MAVVGGVGNGVQFAPVISGVQRLTPQPLQGRVMGALESLSAVSPAVGLALGGALVALSSPRTAFAVVGAGAALTTLLFARVHLDRVAPPQATEGGDAPPAPAGRASERARAFRRRPPLSAESTRCAAHAAGTAPLGRRPIGR